MPTREAWRSAKAKSMCPVPWPSSRVGPVGKAVRTVRCQGNRVVEPGDGCVEARKEERQGGVKYGFQEWCFYHALCPALSYAVPGRSLRIATRVGEKCGWPEQSSLGSKRCAARDFI